MYSEKITALQKSAAEKQAAEKHQDKPKEETSFEIGTKIWDIAA